MSATRLNGSHDIILGQAAILASALDARRINAMLQHQATNGWRERQRGGSAFVLRWLRRFGGRGRGRGSSGGCRRRSSTGLPLRRRGATFLEKGPESPNFYRVTLPNPPHAHEHRHRRNPIHPHRTGVQGDNWLTESEK